MKKMFLTILFYVSYFTLSAQSEMMSNHDSIIAEIKSLEAIQMKAILESDTLTLKKIWAEDFHVNSPANNVVNLSQVLERIRNTYIKYSHFESESEYYGVFGDVVIVMGKETVTPIGNNPDSGKTIVRRFTDIYKKINGEWKEIARHANIIR